MSGQRNIRYGVVASIAGGRIGFYFEKARMTLAEMWRKKMEPMKDSERTKTMKGSLSEG